jgi:hypothetical protein
MACVIIATAMIRPLCNPVNKKLLRSQNLNQAFCLSATHDVFSWACIITFVPGVAKFRWWNGVIMKESKTNRKKPAVKESTAEAASSAKSAASGTKTAKETTTSSAPPAPRTPVIDEEPKLPASRGKVGIFGGPKDRGIKPDDKLALPTGPHGVYERVRTLSPKSFYCAMRWNYHVEHMSPEEVKRWWANKKLLLTNTNNGKAVVVRAVDYGPHENTGLDVGVSPGAAEALGVEIGDEVDIALADPKSALGPTN